MEQKTDLRIIKTRKALTEAFWLILSEKKFEDITVNGLCDKAMVRRATFYKHFADKVDFFAFLIRTKQAEFDAQSQQPTLDMPSQSLYVEIFKHSLDFLKSNKKLVHSILESNMLPTIMEILSRQIALDVTRKLKEEYERGVLLPASPQVMAQFFSGALVYTMMWWVKQKQVSEAELMEELTCLLRAF